MIEAASMMVEQKPDLEMKLKLGNMIVKALLADFGDRLHIAKLGDRYVVVLEGDGLEFDRGISPVELLMPEPLDSLVGRSRPRLGTKSWRQRHCLTRDWKNACSD